MENEIRKCTRCNWTGYDAKWVLCSVCDSTYYKCPLCGNKTGKMKRYV